MNTLVQKKMERGPEVFFFLLNYIPSQTSTFCLWHLVFSVSKFFKCFFYVLIVREYCSKQFFVNTHFVQKKKSTTSKLWLQSHLSL